MSKEFKIKKATNYFITYLKSMAIFIPLSVAVIIRIQTSDMHLKKELTLSIILLITLLLVAGIVRYFLAKEKIIIIGEHSLQIVKNDKMKDYHFSKLTRIKRTSKKLINKTGMDVLEIYFDGEKKLKLSNSLPFYHELRDYLRNTLKGSGYYEKINIDNEL